MLRNYVSSVLAGLSFVIATLLNNMSSTLESLSSAQNVIATLLSLTPALAKLPTASSKVESSIAMSSNRKMEGSCYTNEKIFEKKRCYSSTNVPAGEW